MRPEHRKEARIAKTLPAVAERVATILKAGQERVVRVVLVDLSREGVGFISPEPFDEGALVRLTIEMEASGGMMQTGRFFVTAVHIRNCVAVPDESRGGRPGFKVGAIVREQTGRQWESWNELIRRWSRKVL